MEENNLTTVHFNTQYWLTYAYDGVPNFIVKGIDNSFNLIQVSQSSEELSTETQILFDEYGPDEPIIGEFVNVDESSSIGYFKFPDKNVSELILFDFADLLYKVLPKLPQFNYNYFSLLCGYHEGVIYWCNSHDDYLSICSVDLNEIDLPYKEVQFNEDNRFMDCSVDCFLDKVVSVNLVKFTDGIGIAFYFDDVHVCHIYLIDQGIGYTFETDNEVLNLTYPGNHIMCRNKTKTNIILIQELTIKDEQVTIVKNVIKFSESDILTIKKTEEGYIVLYHNEKGVDYDETVIDSNLYNEMEMYDGEDSCIRVEQ